MRKNVKRIAGLLLSMVIVIGTMMTVSAETSYLDVTYPYDTLSLKTMKSSAYYENRAYVTATYFNQAGTFQCMSACYENAKIVSMDMYVSGNGGYTGETGSARDSAAYYLQAPADVYYYLSVSGI